MYLVLLLRTKTASLVLKLLKTKTLLKFLLTHLPAAVTDLWKNKKIKTTKQNKKKVRKVEALRCKAANTNLVKKYLKQLNFS